MNSNFENENSQNKIEDEELSVSESERVKQNGENKSDSTAENDLRKSLEPDVGDSSHCGSGYKNNGSEKDLEAECGGNDNDTEEPEKKKPWFLTPSVTVEADYNPYRSEESVFEETFKKHPGVFRGAMQLENETPAMFYYRRREEWGFARAQAKKSLSKSSMYVALVLMLYLFLSNFFAICFNGMFGETVTEILLTSIQYLIIAPIVVILANIGLKHKVPTFFKKPQVSWLYILKWCVIAIGSLYAVSILGNILLTVMQLVGIYVNDLSQPIPDTPLKLIVYFLSVVVGAPIFEEILFRGVLLTHLKKYGCWFAIIVTGVLFGLIHQNYHQMFFAAAVGIIFAYIDIKSGSIIPSLIAHAFVNFYSFMTTFLLYFTNYNETVKDPSLKLDGPTAVIMISGILNMLVYVLILIAIVLLVYEVTKNKSELTLPKGDSFLTEKEKYNAFIMHPAMIVLLILLAISIFFISFFNLNAITEPLAAIFK